MAVKLQLRRGTASEWTNSNPTLAAGEMGIETDTNKAKVGDGTTAWNSLPYFAGGGGASSNVFSSNVIIDVSTTDPALRVTQRGTGLALRVEDSTTPDASPFVVDANGKVGISTEDFTNAGQSRLVISRLGGAMTLPENIQAETTLLVHSGPGATGSGAAMTIAGGNTSVLSINFADTEIGTAGRIIYNHATDSFAFRTNGVASDKMTISSDGQIGIGGQVGIGTSFPSYPLHVVSQSNFNPQIVGYHAGNTSGSGAYFIVDRARGTTASRQTVQSGDILGTFMSRGYNGTDMKNSAWVQFVVDGTVTSNVPSSAQIYTTPATGATKVTAHFDASGNVGIGTTDPGALLEVAGTGSPTVRINSTNALEPTLQLLRTGGTGFQLKACTDINLYLDTANSSSTIKRILSINGVPENSGSLVTLGPATGTVPYNMLHTVAEGAHGIRLQRTGAFPADVAIRNEGSALTLWANGSGGIQFQTSNGAVAPTEKMRITSDGRVGIGVTNFTGASSSKLVLGRLGGTMPTPGDIAGDNTLLVHAGGGATGSGVTTTLLGGNASSVSLNFADTESGSAGRIYYNHATDAFGFRTNNVATDRMTISSAGRIGIANTNPPERLFVSGNIAATGTITASYSDERLKERLGNVNNSINIIQSLNGFKYKNNDLAKSLGYGGDAVQIGLSAQEVEKVLPEVVSLAPFDMARDEQDNLVSKSGNNYLTLDYSKLVPVLIEAVKELAAEVEKLKRRE